MSVIRPVKVHRQTKYMVFVSCSPTGRHTYPRKVNLIKSWRRQTTKLDLASKEFSFLTDDIARSTKQNKHLIANVLDGHCNPNSKMGRAVWKRKFKFLSPAGGLPPLPRIPSPRGCRPPHPMRGVRGAATTPPCGSVRRGGGLPGS
jgi:hypothetical protein